MQKKYEKNSPAKGVRNNLMYTIKNCTLDDLTSDDNGAYVDSNSVKTQYYVQVDEKKQTVKTLKVHETYQERILLQTARW